MRNGAFRIQFNSCFGTNIEPRLLEEEEIPIALEVVTNREDKEGRDGSETPEEVVIASEFVEIGFHEQIFAD